MPKRELILLALDESHSLQLMERALLAAGYEVAIVHDTSGLEKALDESTPALLLIGEKFNQQNGIEISTAQLERFPTLPILLYGEQERPATLRAVLDAGLSGYLHPPLKTDDIVEAVKRSLARARHLGDWIRREVKRTTSSLAQRAKISEAERSRLASILANIEGGVIVLDEDDNILLINRVACEAFTLESTDWVGKPVLEVISHPDLRALLSRPASDSPRFYEINFDNGSVFHAQHTPIPHIGSAITMQDISYLKLLDQMKNDFVHTVSHDLRSPLTAVLGYAELIERSGPLNPQQLDFMHRMQGSIQNITTLVNDLLDLGRLEAGFESRHEPVQLENILKASLGVLDSLARKKNLRLEQEIAPQLPPMRANPTRIRQMVDNLINNAIKYTPEGGIVQIRALSEDQQIILEVTDNGPGIPIGEQARIFDKFYRASNVNSNVKGTGLGLAIVKSIVDNHHGRVWVESKVGQGASFFVVLPAFDQTENPDVSMGTELD